MEIDRKNLKEYLSAMNQQEREQKHKHLQINPPFKVYVLLWKREN